MVGQLRHQGVLELRDRSEDLEEHPADRSGGVDALVEDDEADTALLELPRQLDEVFQGVAEPVGCWSRVDTRATPILMIEV